DKDMALLIEDFLLEADHRVTIAADGAAALDALTAGRFDLVLMDGRLSDMSGIEVTARIRRLAGDGAGIPIVALTGEALDGDRERYLAAGMDGYITKPIDYDRLISTIETCCCAHSWPLAANP
ncbi:MAG: response regulator, partial [Geminicoccaceae bacterium]